MVWDNFITRSCWLQVIRRLLLKLDRFLSLRKFSTLQIGNGNIGDVLERKTVLPFFAIQKKLFPWLKEQRLIDKCKATSLKVKQKSVQGNEPFHPWSFHKSKFQQRKRFSPRSDVFLRSINYLFLRFVNRSCLVRV